MTPSKDLRQMTSASEWRGVVERNSPRGGEYFVLRITVPPRFPNALAGSFIMLSVGRESEILLRRPMAIYDLFQVRRRKTMEILYTVVGRGTRALTSLRRGSEISFLGPIGNSFSRPKEKGNTYVVAGGVGIAPFLLWGRQLSAAEKKKQKLLLGFRSHKQAILARDFSSRTSVRPYLAIEEKLKKKRSARLIQGTVIDLFRDLLENEPLPAQVLTCGPEKMMEKVIEISRGRNIPVEASLETKMGCGMGVCLSCVTEFVPKGSEKPYSLVCQDGPIFELGAY